MELKIDESSTLKLKSSPISIKFINFNHNEEYCFHCSEIQYTETLLFKQKYCKECFLQYVTNIKSKDSKLPFISDSQIYLDLHISTQFQCNKHETSRNENFVTRNIKEWCEKCSIISYFKQIPSNSLAYCDSDLNFEIEKNKEVIESEKDCKFCGKIIYPSSLLPDLKLKMCSNCYQISCGSVESTSTKEKEIIPVLHLPWWGAFDVCVICKVRLIFEDINQKVCPHCFIIYSGCRYCLTTNIIFGYTNQSQCKKCKREIPIVMNKTNISIGNNEIDDFFYSKRNIINNRNIVDYVDYIDKYDDNPLNVYKYLKEKIYEKFNPEAVMEWIPYDRIKDLKEITRGGFSTIYQATWSDGGIIGTAYSSCYRVRNETIAIKKLCNFQDILNEIIIHSKCYRSERVIRCYGVTKDFENEYMLVIEFADGDNLHDFLQKNFSKITWIEKLEMLWQISYGLETIHNAGFVHRDFHSGNILLVKSFRKWKTGQWQIGDFGLSQPVSNANETNGVIPYVSPASELSRPTSNTDGLYGVMPYMAPELFERAPYSEASDVYSMGMIMWELTTGCKPFANIEHDVGLMYKIIDGKRPKFTDDTPKCFANLIRRCWDSDPEERPSITEIRKDFSLWRKKEKFNQAEEKRVELIKSKKLGPDFTNKFHSNTINAIAISEYSINSINSAVSAEAFDTTQKFTFTSSRECELDIDVIQRSNDNKRKYFQKDVEKEVFFDGTKKSRTIKKLKKI